MLYGIYRRSALLLYVCFSCRRHWKNQVTWFEAIAILTSCTLKLFVDLLHVGLTPFHYMYLSSVWHVTPAHVHVCPDSVIQKTIAHMWVAYSVNYILKTSFPPLTLPRYGCSTHMYICHVFGRACTPAISTELSGFCNFRNTCRVHWLLFVLKYRGSIWSWPQVLTWKLIYLSTRPTWLGLLHEQLLRYAGTVSMYSHLLFYFCLDLNSISWAALVAHLVYTACQLCCFFLGLACVHALLTANIHFLSEGCGNTQGGGDTVWSRSSSSNNAGGIASFVSADWRGNPYMGRFSTSECSGAWVHLSVTLYSQA